MSKILSFLGNPWTLFAFSVLCFSLSVYVLTGLLVVWGIGFLVAAIGRAFLVDRYGNVSRRNY